MTRAYVRLCDQRVCRRASRLKCGAHKRVTVSRELCTCKLGWCKIPPSKLPECGPLQNRGIGLQHSHQQLVIVNELSAVDGLILRVAATRKFPYCGITHTRCLILILNWICRLWLRRLCAGWYHCSAPRHQRTSQWGCRLRPSRFEFAAAHQHPFDGPVTVKVAPRVPFRRHSI